MDRYEQFRSAATDRGLPEDEAVKFADHLRFVVWLGTAGPDEQVVGQEGGLPRLPVGTDWPADGDGTPLPFIASIDCALLPRAEGLPLPEDGSLLFFLNHDDDVEAEAHTEEPVHARVLHVPVGTETAVASPPPDHETRTFFHENLPFLQPERRLTAWVEPALPKWITEEDYDFDSLVEERLFEGLKHVDELRELVDVLWPEVDRSSGFRLGGYCARIGGAATPWTQMTYAGFADVSDAGEYQLVREWVPLAQFYTASEFYYGCFLICFDDLAARRFENMRSFTMFTE